MRLGIATSSKCPALIPAEQILVERLRKTNISSTPLVWNDPDVDWNSLDAILIRSIWDYHLYPQEFLAWLSRLEAIGMPVWNPIPVLRWNHHKFYLKQLASRGIEVVPTLFVARGTDPVSEAKRSGWDRLVVKPAVSASSYRTRLIGLHDAATSHILAEYTQASDFLLQPFLPEIEQSGEISMIFFDGEFSHAVQKRPAAGEFRVQAELGGHEVPLVPERSIIEAAHRILEASGFETLYARVDGIVREKKFLLMELELIEPDLFLNKGEGAIEQFAESIISRR